MDLIEKLNGLLCQNEATLEELRELPFMAVKGKPSNIIIVPMDAIHDSGFRCMKFILTDRENIICGVVGGWSDIIRFNGFNGSGYLWKPFVMPVPYCIDCLAKSGCIRLMTGMEFEIDGFVGSDFTFYVKEGES